MDVTFTNVLEGARQYFQGLPAATSASAVPTYSSVSEASLHNHPHHHRTHHQHQHHYNEPQSNKENGGGDVAPNGSGGYWPPVPQRPPNQQQSSNYSGNYQQQPQQQQQHSQEQQMYSYSSRPHSRENNQYNNNQQQTCYSSQRQDLTTLQPPPPPPPSSSSSATNQNYHYHPSGYVYGASSSAPSPTSRSYNYNAKISNTTTTTPTTVSSQNNNNQDNNLYYKHLYSPHSSTAVATSSSAPPPLQSSSAQYRSTHNLPPIASLSLTSYHSNKNIKPSSGRSTMATTTTTTATNSKVNNHRYLTQEQYRSNNYVQQQQQPYNNATPTTSQNYTQVIMTATSANTSQTYHQSSSVNHHLQQQQQSYYQQQQPGKQSSSSTVNGGRLPAAQQPSTPSVLPQSIHLNKQKKESPLDLSVKTVRTPADSTLDDADHDNRTKYYRTDRPHHNNYPTCDVYGNSFNRNTSRASNLAASTTTSAPKVEFHPNFNVSINAQQNYHQRRTNTNMNNNNNNTSRVNNTTTTTSSDANNKVRSMGCYPTVSVPTAAHVNSYIQSTIPPKRQQQQQQQRETLPRIDFPSPGHGHKTAALYPVATRDADNKRPADTPPPSMIPNKMCKVDTWRQTIDQQIEQRLSSHLQQQEAKNKAAQQAAVKQQQQQQHNGNYSQETTNNYNNSSYQQYPNTHHLNQRYSYPNHSHNQTYVPSAGAHQYPGGYGGYPNNLQHSTTHHQPNYMSTSSQQQQPRPNFSSKTNSNNNNHSGADKRVITLLRNSLESKGVANKEAAAAHQKKIEQTANYKHQHVQHPTTDVTAPLQPKPSFINRHNVSPFTPTNLPENHNMTMYKLHLPKAIDSVNFDADSAAKMVDGQVSNINPNGDLDGLAAFLAARIRTKAELKQVGPSSNNNSQQPQHHVKQETDPSPPKLSKEQQLLQQKHAFPPRRRLFSRNEDDAPYSTNSVPPRDKSGMRSSSETSVFDFPDTDSDSEMPVLERQSLEDMRRDRKAAAELKPPPSPGDDMFKQCCDSFVEQLKNGCGKKRGRRKKMVEADVIAKLETVVTKDKPLTDEVVTIKKEIEEETPTATTNIKQEIEDEPSMQEQDHNEEEEEGDDDQDDDGNESDVPLNKLKDNSSKQKLDTQILKEIPSLVLPRPAKKPSFGDGSDFCPGWEEEVYKYKKSLRMPPSLIQVTRPPQYHRLSTSLPDLDPCPNSPTPSLPTADNINDYLNMKNQKMKIKLETTAIDSDDTESNNSFNLFGLSSNKHHYDSEGGSSINSLPNMVKENNSILDKLLEKCGGRKKRKSKRKDELYPKIVPKPDKPVELLATPTKEEQAKTDAISLGFRTKTINNFKNVFNKNVKELRSRKSNNHRHHRISIKEVFGEDRPASAPPVTCLNNIKVKEELTDDGEDNVSLSSLAKLQQKHHDDTKQALKNKLLNRNRKDGGNLLKTLVDKKIKSELLVGEVDKFQGQQQSVVVAGEDEEIDCKSETPSIDGDEGVGGGAASGKINKQRNKLTKIRRKLSSGFDYIRKKKKSVKKSDNNNQDNNSEANLKVKQRKNLVSSKSNPGSVQDIQKEIKGWVLNKGIGETILHRSARLGYTDITAYCLENMECLPSPKDNAGYTPLHEASTKGHLGIAKMLLLYGANVSESARGGIRPLHEAVENGYVEIVRLLLSYGADPLLATYAGITPLQLASDEATINLLQNHINDVQGRPSSPWIFPGPASCFDLIESGFNLLDDEPIDVIESEEDDIDFEMSDHLLPNLYTLRSESNVDRWVLLQDLSNLLKIKSRDALLRQICGNCSAYKSVLRELKMSDFLEQAHCCQFLNIGEKINTRASKIALVKYTDKVKELLKVEKVSISIR